MSFIPLLNRCRCAEHSNRIPSSVCAFVKSPAWIIPKNNEFHLNMNDQPYHITFDNIGNTLPFTLWRFWFQYVTKKSKSTVQDFLKTWQLLTWPRNYPAFIELKDHYRVHKNTSLDPILSHTNLISVTRYCLRITISTNTCFYLYVINFLKVFLDN